MPEVAQGSGDAAEAHPVGMSECLAGFDKDSYADAESFEDAMAQFAESCFAIKVGPPAWNQWQKCAWAIASPQLR